MTAHVDTVYDGLSLIASRHCKRAFLDRTVPRDVLAEVLLAAGQAPPAAMSSRGG